jgi:hypothetical protein
MLHVILLTLSLQTQQWDKPAGSRMVESVTGPRPVIRIESGENKSLWYYRRRGKSSGGVDSVHDCSPKLNS